MNRTKIEYLDYTWNPVCMRCDRVSEGCANCWHLTRAAMLANNPVIKPEERAVYKGRKPFLLRREELDAPLRLKKPARIGVQFMGDLFHEAVDTHWIDDILEVIGACPQHTFLMLTKRPENIERKLYEVTEAHGCRELGGNDYLPNLWLGVTVENQMRAEKRIPILLSILAEKHFVSVEPMLGPVHLDKWLLKEADLIDWVIAGPETGPEARPCFCYWMMDLLSECREAGIPFFDKREDYLMREWPR